MRNCGVGRHTYRAYLLSGEFLSWMLIHNPLWMANAWVSCNLCPYSQLSVFFFQFIQSSLIQKLVHYLQMCWGGPNQSDYFVCCLCQNRIMRDDLCDHVWEFHFTKVCFFYVDCSLIFGRVKPMRCSNDSIMWSLLEVFDSFTKPKLFCILFHCLITITACHEYLHAKQP